MTELPPSQIDSRLHGNGLRLVRVIWVIVALAALGIFIFSLPGYLRPMEAQPIQASAEFIVVLNGIGLLASLAAAVVSLALAGLLFWRRPDDKMALFLSFFFLGYGIVMGGPLDRLRLVWPGLHIDVELAQAMIFTTLFAALFGLFPNGRFTPGWMRWVTLASLGFIPLYYLLPCCDFSKVNSGLLSFLMFCWLAMMAAVAYAQVYRYRQTSTPAERQQTKWVVYGLVLFLALAIVSTIPYIMAQRLPPDAPRPWWTLLASMAWWLSLAIMPLSLTFSILRFRLFDIDLIIKRTVQYTLLSGAGFVVYLLAVGGTSLFIRSNTQLVAGVIVLALLVVFFNPARKRLQMFMDKVMPYTPPPPEVLAELNQQRIVVTASRVADGRASTSVTSAKKSVANWLTLARLGWLAFFAFAVLALLLAIPMRWLELTQPSPTLFANLRALGWPMMGYAVYSLTTELIFTVAFLAVGLLIFARRSNDGMALFMSLTLVAYGVGNQTITPTINAVLVYPFGQFIYPWLPFAAWVTFSIFPYLFPNGRFVPRWARILAVIWFVLCIPWNFLPSDSAFNPFNWPPLIFVPLLLFMWGSWVVCQVYRYARVSTPVERQQTKWVMYALALGVAVIMLMFVGALVMGRFDVFTYLAYGEPPTPQDLAFIVAFQTVARLVFSLLLLAFAFSIFRYRLWDIDIVIKRTVQYALISGAGFVVYLLAVGGTSLFIRSNTQLIAGVIVLALLVIFFNPARKRLQMFMDKVMPYTPPPPEVLAEMERDASRVNREKKIEKEMQTQTIAEGALRGRWLTAARGGWIITALISLGLLLASLPSGYALLNTVCATEVCEWGQLTPAGAHMLAGLGLSVTAYALFFSSLVTLMNLSYMVIGWFIFWRKSADRAALFISWAMVLAGTVDSGVVTFQLLYPTLFTPLALFRGAGYACFFVLFIIFPNGQFVPRWSRWLILPILAGQTIAFLLIQTAPEVNTVFSAVWLTFGLGAQFYRYLRVSGPVERQQTKWVLVGFAATIVPFLIWPLLSFVFPTLFSPFVNGVVVATVGDIVWWVLMLLGAFLLPVGLAFSMFRYRLWAVDLVIRRTVQYAVITATGFVVYLLAVGGTSLFLQARNDLLAGALALGAVGAAFIWLRPRLEAWMNKFMPLPQRPLEAAPLPPAPTTGLESTSAMSRPLSTFWQRLVRIGWVALALNSLWAFGWTLVYTWDLAHTPPPRITAGLAALNLSADLYFWVNALPIALMFLSYFIVAVALFWRRPNDRMALFVAVFLMGLGVANAYPAAPEFLRVWETGGLQYVIPFGIANFLGWPLLVAFFALYPDGMFVPGWMRYIGVYGFVFATLWGLFPRVFGEPQGLLALFVYGSVIIIFGGSLYAQVYRYRRHATPLQRQQIKWMVASIALVTVVIVAQSVVALLNPQPTAAQSVQREFIFMPLNLLFALLPIAVGLAMMRYRLFEIEVIVRRTVIYGAIVGGLGVLYFGGVALLQWLSQALTGPQSNFVVVLITLGIVALFNPVRRRFQVFIDRAFYREKVDFREAFTAFAREVRTIIDLPELLRTLVNRTTDLFHITHGAVLLRQADGQYQIAEARNLPDTQANDRALHLLRVGLHSPEMTSEADAFIRLREGAPLAQARDKELSHIFPLIVPLMAVQTLGRTSQEVLIGALALGPRRSDQNYSREDQTMLSVLADQAGTALYVAQLIQEKQAETQRIEAAERRLESYANSPAGRAERFAQLLITNNQSLQELHTLTQTAGSDPATAAMLEPLSAALTALHAPTLAGLADGYRYVFASQTTPEVLPVGLRTLTDSLAQLDAPEALELYRLCQKALEANSISAIVEQGLAMSNYSLPITNDFKSLVDGLQELAPAADALRAYERVDSQPDKLAYLANAVERLTHADRAAQAELGAADRPIVQRIAANWLTVVTGAMSELQTRARLACRLLTRHTWTGEVIAVSLAIRNEGRGAALNLKVALAPAPDYTLVDESVIIERLAAGEEAQAELRVRPHIGDKTGTTGGQFRARFVIVYADPRGPDQTENFADVVYLLALEGEFKFIPNPYVVGTPLQTGSALFCGREDVFEFIQENLVAAHQNNLVLIGQRRTGKTSLLKQLPSRLGEKYVSVYLDGQSLALDPGLPNFFYSLATEIAFALEDRGLEIGELPDFNDSPATTFERKFLARVREVLGDRHLLLLLDEFEELEGAVRRGNLDVSVFSFLRHMIQHSHNLSVIFCGTHRMEELAADYWSVLFNISLYRHVAFLQQAEAFKLIQGPVSDFGMKYDDLALDKMWRVTAGHPYFLQLLCHSLVNQHNKSKRNYVTVADVNAALDEILASGEAHFIFLWTESTRAERLALTALSRMMPLTGQTNPAQVTDYLAERGVPLERRAVSEALHHLALRDTLRVNRDLNDSGGFETFSWQLGLLGLWVEKYKSLSRVVDEVRE